MVYKRLPIGKNARYHGAEEHPQHENGLTDGDVPVVLAHQIKLRDDRVGKSRLVVDPSPFARLIRHFKRVAGEQRGVALGKIGVL